MRPTVVLTVLVAVLATATASAAATLPPGFSEETIATGLRTPTAMAIAPDGRIFVAEKGGQISVLDGPADSTPSTVIDMRSNVHNFYDRGLLGLALAPDFATNPALYAAYSYDAKIGQAAPRWGTQTSLYDGCPTPPGPTDDGCIGAGRIVRVALDGDQAAGPEQVLIEDYCQQYPSHSVGALLFDAAGRLYASAGDAASYNFLDYGQDGSPVNPCGDPPGGVGGAMSPPDAEGGSLRSQDLWTPFADPTGLDGTVIRIDPATAEGVPGNPRAGSTDANNRRVVAYGLRQPFRMALRPGTEELWVGDVGQGRHEEINRFVPGSAEVNFGWPCYEGRDPKPGWDAADFTTCEGLYGSGLHREPYFVYDHHQPLVSGENCPDNGSSVTALAFYDGGSFPASFDGALLFGDYSRSCIWAMPLGADGEPDPGQLEIFAEGLYPVDLEVGPDGSLYYVDVAFKAIKRIRYTPVNSPPVAVASADPLFGDAPLTVSFDGSASSDPDPGDSLSYAWDLDGDGQFDDSTEVSPAHTYEAGGEYLVSLRVSDSRGEHGTASLTVSVGNGAPVPVIDAPTPGLSWGVGETISFSGSASDREDGTLPASALDWRVDIHHCALGCHTHEFLAFEDTGSGSFVTPDHDYPSELVLTLTATDSEGKSAETSLTLPARWIRVIMAARRVGIPVALNDEVATTPFVTKVIPGSRVTISGPTPQVFDERIWEFDRWNHGGERTQTVVAPQADVKYIAWYRDRGPAPDPDPGGNTPPLVTITAPAPDLTWGARDPIAFEATTSDAEQGTLPPEAVRWTIETERCDPVCSRTPLAEHLGASGTVDAPADPRWPVDLVLTATATDAGGLSHTDTRRISARAIDVIMAARRVGIPVTLNDRTETTPFVTQVVAGSDSVISAPTPQNYDGHSWEWVRWEHGGERTQSVTVPGSGNNVKYVARYRITGPATTRAAARERGGAKRGERRKRCKQKRPKVRKRCRRSRR